MDLIESPELEKRGDERFWNPDIAPTPLSARTWDYWQIAALWVGMSVCIPSYMLAAGMVSASRGAPRRGGQRANGRRRLCRCDAGTLW